MDPTAQDMSTWERSAPWISHLDGEVAWNSSTPMSGQLCIPSDALDGLGRERDQVFDSESSGSRWCWSPRDGLSAGKVHSGQPRSRLAKAIGVANGDLRPGGTSRKVV
ncbi:hypothetical protein H310_07074 [Aphanomyces invadans]|uniref:Uncharacterized protein n=1 Tax=Aphanomyces invadans TaxID=157072 RepID=A0A024U2J6_9STRA|nr:hypothetical protein H310_07074 [Aphanomyces invadans]ETW00449.1 hypothetical protein H310_07074 [Aphanomyces invadans]|eukprot:XP_008870584.1 hypothetical protein H310_07074 [Aphanomyces invadans]